MASGATQNSFSCRGSSVHQISLTSLPSPAVPLNRNRKKPGVGAFCFPLPPAFLCPSDAGIAPTRPGLLLCWALDRAPHPPLSPTPLPLPPGSLPFERPGSQTCSHPSALPVTRPLFGPKHGIEAVGGLATPPHPPRIPAVLRDLDSSGSFRGLCEC